MKIQKDGGLCSSSMLFILELFFGKKPSKIIQTKYCSQKDLLLLIDTFSVKL